MFLLDLGGDGGFSLKTLFFFFSFSANNHQLCVAEPPSSSKSLAPSSNLDLVVLFLRLSQLLRALIAILQLCLRVFS